MTNRCNLQLLECIFDYFMHASYFWWRMLITTNLFFSWCIYSYPVSPLDRMHELKSAK